MSSKATEEKFVRVENTEEEQIDIKHVFIPFSLFFLKDEHLIYDGSEKIPFHKRDPLYQAILLQEFKGIMRDI